MIVSSFPLSDQKEREGLQVKGDASRVSCQNFISLETDREKKGKWKWGLRVAVWLFKVTQPAQRGEEGKEVNVY